MTSILDQAIMDGNVGGIGVLNRSSAQRSAQREEAERLGQAAARAQGGEDVDKKLRGVAEEFVTVFMNQVMKSMRSTVQENPEMHGDNGEKFFQEMLDSEYAGSLAQGSGYGLTDLVYQALASKSRVSQPFSDGAAEAGLGVGSAIDGEEL